MSANTITAKEVRFIKLAGIRGQIRSWLFTVDSGKGRSEMGSGVFVWISREQPRAENPASA